MMNGLEISYIMLPGKDLAAHPQSDIQTSVIKIPKTMRIKILIDETKYGRDSVGSILILSNLECLIMIMEIELYYDVVKMLSHFKFRITCSAQLYI